MTDGGSGAQTHQPLSNFSVNTFSGNRRVIGVRKSLWNHLTNLFEESREAEGFTKAVPKYVRALGALGFRAQHQQLLELRLFQMYIATASATDVLFHLSHRYFLSNALTYRQRIECALSHYTAYKHKLRFPQVDSKKGSLNLCT
jgi:hypothetical protein